MRSDNDGTLILHELHLFCTVKISSDLKKSVEHQEINTYKDARAKMFYAIDFLQTSTADR